MKKIYLSFVLLIVGYATYAQKLPFQGYLEESGVPVDGVRTFEFELTDYGWTETIVDVPVDNGIYNIILGESTPLPDSIFSDRSETSLTIAVNSINIGSVTLYKPLISTKSLLSTDGNFEIKGPNDSLSVSIGNTANGYYGNIGLFDSLGVTNGFLRARNNGGYLQLTKLDASGNFQGAITAGTNNGAPSLNLFGQNTTLDNASLMINNYTTGNQIDNGPEMGGNYKRSGTDWSDNEGRLLAAVGNARDALGADPTGSSGYLSLWGTNSFNVELTGKRWENNDLPILQLFGRNDDANGWWQANAAIDVVAGTGNSSFANMALYTTNDGGENNQSVYISSNLFGSSAGGLELRDSIGNTTAILEARGNGNSGQLILRGNSGSDVAAIQNRGGNSGQAVFFGPSGGLKAEVGSFGDDSGFLLAYGPNGNKNVQLDRDPGNTNLGQFSLFGEDGIAPRVFATAATDGTNEWGSLTLDGPGEQINLDGNSGIGFFANAAIGQQTNGIVHLYGEQGATADNLRLQLEVRPDGSGSSFGFIEVRDSAFNSTIQIDGNAGAINAFGTISGTSVVQTSDKRYKKEITTLNNSLEKTLKLRGVSYFWKEENKSKKRQIGVIAQEIEEIYPEFVHTNNKGYKSVNYSQMTAVLIEAVKELNAKIAKLETENAELTTALNETKQLSERIGKLEKLLLEGNALGSN